MHSFYIPLWYFGFVQALDVLSWDLQFQIRLSGVLLQDSSERASTRARVQRGELFCIRQLAGLWAVLKDIVAKTGSEFKEIHLTTKGRKVERRKLYRLHNYKNWGRKSKRKGNVENTHKEIIKKGRKYVKESKKHQVETSIPLRRNMTKEQFVTEVQWHYSLWIELSKPNGTALDRCQEKAQKIKCQWCSSGICVRNISF